MNGYLDDNLQRPPVTKSRRRQCSQKHPRRENASPQKCGASGRQHVLRNLTPSSAAITASHETTSPATFTPPLALSLLLTLLFFADQSTLMLQLFRGLFCPHGWPREILRPSRVCICAAFAVGTEAGKVEQAELSANVSLGAEWAQFTESPIVVLTGWQSGLFANVLIETVIAVGTVSGPGEGLAFGHAT